MRLSSALRAVALIEAAKGTLFLLAGIGLLSLVHRDIQRFAGQLLVHVHLNPAAMSSSVYVPLELVELHERVTWLGVGALCRDFRPYLAD